MFDSKAQTQRRCGEQYGNRPGWKREPTESPYFRGIHAPIRPTGPLSAPLVRDPTSGGRTKELRTPARASGASCRFAALLGRHALSARSAALLAALDGGGIRSSLARIRVGGVPDDAGCQAVQVHDLILPAASAASAGALWPGARPTRCSARAGARALQESDTQAHRGRRAGRCQPACARRPRSGHRA